MRGQWVMTFGCLALIAVAANAQPLFRTIELKRLVEVTGVEPASLHEGWNYPSTSGQELVVCMKDSMVSHVGLRLFPEDIRQLDHSPVFNFLERYFLQLKFPPPTKTTTLMLRDDGVMFEKGTPQTIAMLKPTDAFTYEQGVRRYTARWIRQGATVLQVSFPIERELISGENKIESEQLLERDILTTAPAGNTSLGDGQKKNRNAHYVFDDFSNRLYYDGDDLVLNEDHPVESAANLMLSQQLSGDYRLHVSQMSYGFKEVSYDVSLSQWIAFCHDSGCELFFGVEETPQASLSDGVLKAVVVAVNAKQNYNHVLAVQIPLNVIAHRGGRLDAQLHPYVPMHNVRNMFATFRKSNHKKP